MAADWAKLHLDVLDSPKVMTLEPDVFRTWTGCVLIAKRTGADGILPPIANIAFVLRIPPDQAEQQIRTLIETGLIDETDDGLRMHDWTDWQNIESDSAERVRRYRSKKSTIAQQKPIDVTLRNVTGVTCNGVTQIRGDKRREEEIREEKIKTHTPQTPQQQNGNTSQNAECERGSEGNSKLSDPFGFRQADIDGTTARVLKRFGEINSAANRAPNLLPSANDRDRLSQAISQFGSKRCEELWRWSVSSPHTRAKFYRQRGLVTIRQIFDAEKVGELLELCESPDGWSASIRAGPNDEPEDIVDKFLADAAAKERKEKTK